MYRIVLSLSVLTCLIPSLALPDELPVSKDSYAILDRWEAFQSYMHEKGILLDTINTLDVLTNVSGGLRRGTGTAGDFDMLLTVDGEKLFGWEDATVFLYGLGLYGENPSDNVGDIQSISSIAAPNTWKLFEAWYQQDFADHQYSFLAGLYDVTSEFDVIRSSSELFLNSSFGTGGEFGASGRNGPSTFPTTSLGIRGQAFLSDSLAVRAVIADGVPGNPENPNGTRVILDEDDGIFGNIEMAFYFNQERVSREEGREEVIETKPLRLVFQRVGRAAPTVYDGKYALGAWGYTTDFNDLSEVDSSGDPIQRNGSYGFYGLAEQLVFREKNDPEQHLAMFARVGFADPRVNRFSQYYGGGFVYTGLIPNRNVDHVGIGVAATINGSHFRRAQQNQGISVSPAEITIEFNYAINLAPQIVIQPDVQYIINPDTNPAISNALVVGARVQLNLAWFQSPSN